MSVAKSTSAALEEIAVLLELRGDDERARTYRAAAHATEPATDPAIAEVVTELELTGGALLLDELREETPEGVFEMLRLPGLGPARIRRITEGLGIETLPELEAAARDGRLGALPRFGARTAERVLRAIVAYRAAGAPLLLPHAQAEAAKLADAVGARPGVRRVEIAGEVRRHLELVRELVVVAACDGDPVAAAAALAHAPEVDEAIGVGTSRLTLRFDDGVRARIHCVRPDEFGVALVRATGSDAHVRALEARAASRGMTLNDVRLVDAHDRAIPTPDEADVYRALALALVAPELREAGDEVAAAEHGTLPGLVNMGDLRGVLHCHSSYSDGGSSIAALADAARARGWSYIGVTDHSQSALNAGGLTAERVARQHDEIDAVNARNTDVRVLKGVEADILPCGRVDYPVEVLDRFDFVIASVHTRMGMNEAQMTERVLKALDDPHVTILGHPTGRLLLTREPFPIDIDAVLEKAGRTGVAVELNADPHRLDLDWRTLRGARRHGARVSIGPDAHSVDGLDHAAIGVGMARKSWLEPADVLNAAPVDEVLEFAETRRRRNVS
ncbi:MAG TPA: PHP domain-containing protein [Gemmatimonadaceae bacterium]|nr:PHP domain-containing protein [Gemmatimonadaceae bacterium]